MNKKTWVNQSISELQKEVIALRKEQTTALMQKQLAGGKGITTTNLRRKIACLKTIINAKKRKENHDAS